MIHRYKLNGYNIVLDSASGSVHAVDEVAYDIIGLFESKSREEIIAEIFGKYKYRGDVTEKDIGECLDDIQALKDGGKLFAKDTFEPMAGKLKQKSAGVMSARCAYLQLKLLILLCKPGKISRRQIFNES